MREVVVVCGGLPTPRLRRGQEVLRLDTSDEAPPGEHIQIKIDRVLSTLVDHPPEVVSDLFEIAAYVFIADRLVRREGVAMPAMGARWRRHFDFRLPVRCPDLWSQPDISTALIEALCFLSDDSFAFTFAPVVDRIRRQARFRFGDPDARKFRPDSIMMFSGGLDSLAGVGHEIVGGNRRVVLVTHQSANAVAHKQNVLAQALASHVPPGSFAYMPIWVRKGEQDPVEHTQRLRSFLFASLGITIARLCEQKRLLFFENGITSFNLPVAANVVGTRASRTTHPRALAAMSRLASLLFGEAFTIENPFLWMSKSDVVASLGRHGLRSLIPLTTSCAHVRQLSVDQRQCGVCSQCVERQFAMIAAGMPEADPRGTYAVDLFDGPYATRREAAMAVHHVLRAREFTRMSQAEFVASHGEVFRALSCLPGTSREKLNAIYDLHNRYGQSISDAVDGRLRSSFRSLDNVLDLPETSLLPIVTSTYVVDRERSTDAKPDDPPAPTPAPKPVPGNARRRTIVIAVDAKAKRIIFEAGFQIGGKAFDLIAALAERHRQDTASSCTPNSFRFLRAGKLSESLGIEDTAALRQRVMRARKLFGTRYLEVTGYDLDEADVIENRVSRGYRLNPFVILVDAKQIRTDPREVSQPAPADVTTPPAGPNGT